MAQSTINIRVDSDDKKAFDEFCSYAGLNITTAINIFIKRVIHDGAIPFSITGPEPNADTLEALEEMRAMKANPGEARSYASAHELMEDLLS